MNLSGEWRGIARYINQDYVVISVTLCHVGSMLFSVDSKVTAYLLGRNKIEFSPNWTGECGVEGVVLVQTNNFGNKFTFESPIPESDSNGTDRMNGFFISHQRGAYGGLPSGNFYLERRRSGNGVSEQTVNNHLLLSI